MRICRCGVAWQGLHYRDWQALVNGFMRALNPCQGLKRQWMEFHVDNLQEHDSILALGSCMDYHPTVAYRPTGWYSLRYGNYGPRASGIITHLHIQLPLPLYQSTPSSASKPNLAAIKVLSFVRLQHIISSDRNLISGAHFLCGYW